MLKCVKCIDSMQRAKCLNESWRWLSNRKYFLNKISMHIHFFFFNWVTQVLDQDKAPLTKREGKALMSTRFKKKKNKQTKHISALVKIVAGSDTFTQHFKPSIHYVPRTTWSLRSKKDKWAQLLWNVVVKSTTVSLVDTQYNLQFGARCLD